MKHLQYILFLLLPVALASSCINENMENCPPPAPEGFWITFDMLNPYLDYTEEVRHLGLILYDMTGTPTRAGEPTPGNLVAEFQYDLAGLRPSDKAAWVEGVAPGDYHVLAIFNGDEHKVTSGRNDYSTIQTKLEDFGTPLAIEPPSNFLTGELPITVTGGPQTENITLIRHTNDITLNVIYEGYQLPDGMYLDSRIQGNNGAFDYSEHATPDDIFVQTDNWARGPVADALQPDNFSLATMRLCHSRSVMLYLEELPVPGTRAGDTGRTVGIDMAAELAKVTDPQGKHIFDTDEKLETYNIYNFTVTLDGNFSIVSVAVEVDDWDGTGGGIGL